MFLQSDDYIYKYNQKFPITIWCSRNIIILTLYCILSHVECKLPYSYILSATQLHMIPNVPNWLLPVFVASRNNKNCPGIAAEVPTKYSVKDGRVRWNNKRRLISVHTKRNIYNAIVISIFLHGSETWTLKSSDMHKLTSTIVMVRDVFQFCPCFNTKYGTNQPKVKCVLRVHAFTQTQINAPYKCVSL